MENKITEAAGIIAKAVLATLVYMVEHDGRMDFIYFASEQINEDVLYDVQSSVQDILKCDVGIISLQYFSEFDKINLFNNGTVVYCENPMIPRLVELHAAENLKSMMKEKNSMIERKKECGCFYLQ